MQGNVEMLAEPQQHRPGGIRPPGLQEADVAAEMSARFASSS